jgi:hypothetical protein
VDRSEDGSRLLRLVRAMMLADAECPVLLQRHLRRARKLYLCHMQACEVSRSKSVVRRDYYAET